jgi:hypothetical protein
MLCRDFYELRPTHPKVLQCDQLAMLCRLISRPLMAPVRVHTLRQLFQALHLHELFDLRDLTILHHCRRKQLSFPARNLARGFHQLCNIQSEFQLNLKIRQRDLEQRATFGGRGRCRQIDPLAENKKIL